MKTRIETAGVSLDFELIKAAARRTIEREADGLTALARALDGALGEALARAAALIANAQGRAIVTGMGKSGHIARKIAATFASTGRPALFVHPAEASHGDLGMITEEDVVLALSRSGETGELNDLIYHCRRLEIPLIGMTFKPASTLAGAADVALVLPDVGEASEGAPAPTTSTTMCLAMGDALAVALLESKGFTADHFGAIHPGGKLGALLKRVRDVMRAGEDAPLVSADTSTTDAIAVMTRGGIGCVGVSEGGRLIGVVTDGDLRRKLTPDAFDSTVTRLMTSDPKTVSPDTPIADAMALMTDLKITALFVMKDAHVAGVLHMHDLLRAGVR
jgi:arabinose-5-phosphate isomerase